MKKLGILLSGRGSNFEALAASVREGRLDAEIAVVVSNKPTARGLERARELGIPAVALASRGLEREEFDRLIAAELDAAGVDVVCLAGYMRLLSAWFVERYAGRLINIHPSLLPAFPGLDAQQQALEYGVKFSGCTVHFVTEEMDAGPVIIQAVVPVEDTDDEEALSARILKEEHRIYTEAVRLVLSGAFRIEGRRVIRT